MQNLGANRVYYGQLENREWSILRDINDQKFYDRLQRKKGVKRLALFSL